MFLRIVNSQEERGEFNFDTGFLIDKTLFVVQLYNIDSYTLVLVSIVMIVFPNDTAVDTPSRASRRYQST